MSFMSDDAIEAALSQPCIQCTAGTGEECVEQMYPNQPLMETRGVPVHIRRLEL